MKIKEGSQFLETKGFKELCSFLDKNGIVSNGYKESYIKRRLRSRMLRVEKKAYKDYLRILQQNRAELESLRKALSINVTRFFRNLESFDLLREKAIRPLLKSTDKNASGIRVWSAGCAVGAETYSLAIIFLEEIRKLGIKNFPVITGTDFNEKLLARAREGTYGESLLVELNKHYIHKYFDRLPSGDYTLKKEIKQLVSFSLHDLMSKTPPMRRVDLVVCRNVLIYFSAQQQQRLFKVLLDALKPRGYLIMGRTESLSSTIRDRFDPVDLHHRIYRVRPT